MTNNLRRCRTPIEAVRPLSGGSAVYRLLMISGGSELLPSDGALLVQDQRVAVGIPVAAAGDRRSVGVRIGSERRIGE